MTKSKIKKIIIEGPDCSGKSTLVDRIKNLLRWDSKSLHHREGESQFFRYLKEYAGQERIVFDRAHFSEEVYSILWRGGTPFTKKEKSILDEVSFMDSLIILALPALKEMKKRYKSRGFDQQIKFNELKKSRELFCKQFKKIPCLIYRSSNYEELEELIKKVKEVLK